MASLSSAKTVLILPQTLFQYSNQMHILILNVHLVGIIKVFKAQERVGWKILKCQPQLFTSKRLQVHAVHVTLYKIVQCLRINQLI